MDTVESHEFPDQDVALRAPGGETVRAIVRDVSVTAAEGEAVECRLRLELAAATWSRVDAAELFHLGAALRGPGSVEPGREVELEARLETGLLATLAAPDARTVAVQFLTAAEEEPLRATESWFALYVTQAVEAPGAEPGDTLRSGFSTFWAGATPPAEPLDLPMLTVFRDYFEEAGWQYSESGAEPVIHGTAEGRNGSWSWFAIAREERHRATVLGQFPRLTPADRRPAMAELLTRINYGLAAGNFEMDHADGEVRFRTSVLVEGDRLTTALFGNIVEANASAMDVYFAAIAAVADNGVSAEEALQLVED